MELITLVRFFDFFQRILQTKNVRDNFMARLSGSMVALVTPFNTDKDQSVNYGKLAELVQLQAKSGTAAIIPCGTTGETPTLSEEEWARVVSTSIQAARNTGLKVIAGTGSNCTVHAVRMTAQAAEMGADACLVVAPYYNKPTPEGLVRHFKEINAVGLPIVLYNIPGRSGINIAPDTTLRICEACDKLIGIKAANGNLDEITDVAARLSKFSRPVSILSGDDAITLPIMAAGGLGVISVAANIIPSVMSQMVQSFTNGDFNRALLISHAVYEFSSSLLRFGANPMGIKSLMAKAGMGVGSLRLPLCEIPAEQLEKLTTIAVQMRSRLKEIDVNCDETLSSL